MTLCDTPYKSEIVDIITECDDDDVRLFQVGKVQNENEGRVEYCKSGRWILVCNDFWDNDDATVVCRQLGYNVEGKLD